MSKYVCGQTGVIPLVRQGDKESLRKKLLDANHINECNDRTKLTRR